MSIPDVPAAATKAASSLMPVRKIQAVGLAGAVTTIVISLLTRAAHLEIDADLAAAIGVLVSFGIGYVVPAAANE